VDWYSIISTVLAVASIVFGYYWYRKAKQEILPRYTSSSDLTITPSMQNPWDRLNWR
jgi:hypothetical protein